MKTSWKSLDPNQTTLLSDTTARDSPPSWGWVCQWLRLGSGNLGIIAVPLCSDDLLVLGSSQLRSWALLCPRITNSTVPSRTPNLSLVVVPGFLCHKLSCLGGVVRTAFWEWGSQWKPRQDLLPRKDGAVDPILLGHGTPCFLNIFWRHRVLLYLWMIYTDEYHMKKMKPKKNGKCLVTYLKITTNPSQDHMLS